MLREMCPPLAELHGRETILRFLKPEYTGIALLLKIVEPAVCPRPFESDSDYAGRGTGGEESLSLQQLDRCGRARLPPSRELQERLFSRRTVAHGSAGTSPSHRL